MSDDAIRLKNGNLELELRADCGGAVTAMRLLEGSEPVDLLRPASAKTIADRNALDTSCYPLVPFSNRVMGGRFEFGGREYRLAPNLLPYPHPLHGHGWTARWEARDKSETMATLAFSHDEDDYPSTYEAKQKFELSESGLTITFELRNTGSEAMPCGLGLHPFFPKPDGTVLDVTTKTVWLNLDDGEPATRIDVPKRWDFSGGRPLGDIQLDNCFGGWNKSATITWPSRRLRIHMNAQGPAEHVVIYAPPGQDFVCVEPVTNANNAFNLSQRGVENVGVQVLQPGEVLTLVMRLTLERV